MIFNKYFQIFNEELVNEIWQRLIGRFPDFENKGIGAVIFDPAGTALNSKIQIKILRARARFILILF